MYDTAFLDLPPLVGAAGSLRLPGSKSISNRVLLLAGLAAGETIVHDLLDADDTQVMLAALQQLGCAIARSGTSVRVTGLAGRLAVHRAQLFLGNAGTAMRPLAATLALLAAAQGGDFELAGVARMHERPIGDLVAALRGIGCLIDELGAPGFPPLRVHGGELDLGAPIRVRGDVSSQFLTALLLALPLVAQERAIVVEVDGELISKPYVEITLNLLARFGVAITRAGWQRFTIAPQPGGYRSPGEIHVEGDASSASYFIAAGAIGAAGERALRIEGVDQDSIQGDIRFADAAAAMGAQVSSGPGWLEVRRGRWPLAAIELDCNHIPDAAMTLAVMALFADGTTRLTNIASWRVKETDRIAAMAAELRKIGAIVEAGADFIAVTPPAAQGWRAAAIATYDDHRIAMCLALAALNPLAGAQPPVPVRILDPRCVAKTFPDYFETLFGVAQARAGDIPVITVDGPSASGKGTLAAALAERLGYAYLDSGALYRAAALAARDAGLADGDRAATARLAAALELRFAGGRTLLGGRDVGDALRDEAVGARASQISAWPEVRAALHSLQLSMRRLPGLVADGRDMGSVIFPDARLKIFLTASAAERAERRAKQLISKGFSANIAGLRADLEARDERDRNRAAAPLKPAPDALLLDNSGLTIEASVAQVLQWWQERSSFH